MNLADWIDPAKLAPIFARTGRLHLPDVLPEAQAEQLARTMTHDVDWMRTVMLNGKGYDARLADLEKAPPSLRDEVNAVVAEGARTGFQFEFDTWRISDELEAGRRVGGKLAPLEGVYDFLNSEPFLDFVRKLTGDPEAAYCDAQATRYRAGHFLNTHDDELAGKERLYAFVLNLTRDWRTDWGGLLVFQDPDGHLSEGYAPKFNALNIFRVPQMHAVTQVASFVTAERLSITGWIRRASARPS